MIARKQTAEKAREDVESRDIGAPSREPEKAENLKQISVSVDPGDYKALKTVGADLGLGIGATIRFAIRDFLKRRGAR